MANIEKEIIEKFGEKLRVRVNGILLKDDKILMARHRMGKDKFFWNVPGGGMEFGSSAIANLQREFKEETGLGVQVINYLFTYEYLEPPLHAIELFFEVKAENGDLILGRDPELSQENQLISEIRFLDIMELKNIPKKHKHPLFWGINSVNDVRIWKGNFKFENKCIK